MTPADQAHSPGELYLSTVVIPNEVRDLHWKADGRITNGFGKEPGFSPAATTPINPGLQPLTDPPTRRERRARQKSNRSGRRVANGFPLPNQTEGCPILARSLR